MNRVKKKRKPRGRGLLLLVLAVALGAGIVLWARGCTSRGQTPQQVLGVTVETQFAPKGAQNRPGTKRQIRTIVLHETGNTAAGADAAAHGKLQARGGEGKTSWHYTVDDTEIWHSIPDEEMAYHAGDGKDGDGNLHGIGVELCVNEDGDFEKTLENAKKLVGWLMVTYEIEPENIKQHFDFTGKNCPQTLRETGRMEELIAGAQEYAKQIEQEKEQSQQPK